MTRPIFRGCWANAGSATSARALRPAASCLLMVSLLRRTIARPGAGGKLGTPPTQGFLLLSPELAGEPRLADRAAVDHVAGERGARAAHVEPIDLERVQGEVVAMRLVADRGAGAAPARAAEIGVDLRAAERQPGAVGAPGVLLELASVGRDVDDQPVPPARAAGRGVGIVDQQREALRSVGRARPPERRRDIPARAAEAVEHLLHRDRAVRLDVGAAELERRARRALL